MTDINIKNIDLAIPEKNGGITKTQMSPTSKVVGAISLFSVGVIFIPLKRVRS